MGIIRKNKEHLETLTIGQGHSVMAGYIPSSIGYSRFSDDFYRITKPSKESIEKYGFFGSDIDYNTYYPDLNLEDLKPKDEEFIEPMFRLLSETIVSRNWLPTDFSKNGVLKASMKMLLGQTVNCDHETNIGNAIGSVSEVIWQEAYTDGKFKIPAGINGVLKIDAKANPRIARGIMMDPPSIHSNSVTIQFKWDKSHPEMSDEEFWDNLGKYDKKGNLVCRVCTEIIRYMETSLVSHGADPFAQKIGEDGGIVNPRYANQIVNNFKEYNESNHKFYTWSDYKCDTQDSFNEHRIINPKDNKNMNEELQEFLKQIFGKDMLQLEEGKEITADNAKEAISTLISSLSETKTSLQNLQTEKDNLITEKTALTEKVANLEAEVANLKDMSTVGQNYIASLREKAVDSYKKLKGDKADDTIISMLNAPTTALVTLKSLLSDYEAQLEEKFPLACAKCGSKDISRASSVQDLHEEDDVKDEFSFEDIYRKKLNGIKNED